MYLDAFLTLARHITSPRSAGYHPDPSPSAPESCPLGHSPALRKRGGEQQEFLQGVLTILNLAIASKRFASWVPPSPQGLPGAAMAITDVSEELSHSEKVKLLAQVFNTCKSTRFFSFVANQSGKARRRCEESAPDTKSLCIETIDFKLPHYHVLACTCMYVLVITSSIRPSPSTTIDLVGRGSPAQGGSRAGFAFHGSGNPGHTTGDV